MTNKKKIVFLSATKHGLDLIDLINKKYKIHYVITPKLKKKSSSERINAKKFCIKNKIKYKELSSYSNIDELKIFFKKIDVDVLICISWQRIIPKWLIDIPKVASLGAHGSHEGIYMGRGRSPMNWCLLGGKKKFILSLFKINKDDADSGPEIFREKILINKKDNINDLYKKSYASLAKMILKFLITKKVKYKSYNGIYRFLPKLVPNDGYIDWNRTDLDLYNFIRSKISPYPNAFTYLKKKKFFIKSANLIKINYEGRYRPGEIISIYNERKVVVKTKTRPLIIELNDMIKKNIKKGDIFISTNFKKQMRQIIKRHYKQFPKNKLNKMIINLAK